MAKITNCIPARTVTVVATGTDASRLDSGSNRSAVIIANWSSSNYIYVALSNSTFPAPTGTDLISTAGWDYCIAPLSTVTIEAGKGVYLWAVADASTDVGVNEVAYDVEN